MDCPAALAVSLAKSLAKFAEDDGNNGFRGFC